MKKNNLKIIKKLVAPTIAGAIALSGFAGTTFAAFRDEENMWDWPDLIFYKDYMGYLIKGGGALKLSNIVQRVPAAGLDFRVQCIIPDEVMNQWQPYLEQIDRRDLPESFLTEILFNGPAIIMYGDDAERFEELVSRTDILDQLKRGHLHAVVKCNMRIIHSMFGKQYDQQMLEMYGYYISQLGRLDPNRIMIPTDPFIHHDIEDDPLFGPDFEPILPPNLDNLPFDEPDEYDE